MTPPPCAPASRRAARPAATPAPWRWSSVCPALGGPCVPCVHRGPPEPEPTLLPQGTRAPGKRPPCGPGPRGRAGERASRPHAPPARTCPRRGVRPEARGSRGRRAESRDTKVKAARSLLGAQSDPCVSGATQTPAFRALLPSAEATAQKAESRTSPASSPGAERGWARSARP